MIHDFPDYTSFASHYGSPALELERYFAGEFMQNLEKTTLPLEVQLLDLDDLHKHIQAMVRGHTSPMTSSHDQICRVAYEVIVRTHETLNPLPLYGIYVALIVAGSLVGVILLLQLLNVLSAAA